MISIHAPHTGRDTAETAKAGTTQKISIHAPHTGRDDNRNRHTDDNEISIHAPHTGRDVEVK